MDISIISSFKNEYINSVLPFICSSFVEKLFLADDMKGVEFSIGKSINEDISWYIVLSPL